MIARSRRSSRPAKRWSATCSSRGSCPRSGRRPSTIRGAWAGGRYRFIQRYRSGFADNLGEEFDASFARIDRMGPDRFDVMWMPAHGPVVALIPGEDPRRGLASRRDRRPSSSDRLSRLAVGPRVGRHATMSEYQYYEFQAIDRRLGRQRPRVSAGAVHPGEDHVHLLHQPLRMGRLPGRSGLAYGPLFRSASLHVELGDAAG